MSYGEISHITICERLLHSHEKIILIPSLDHLD